MSEKTLVTGAGGFIGSHLVEQLVRDGYSVRAFVHYNSANSWGNLDRLPQDVLDGVEVVAGDLSDGFMVDRAVQGCGLVFHLGALIGIPYSYVAPAAYVTTNITGTVNVLEACRRHHVRRLMHTSTSEVYGSAQYTPIDEQHPLVGQSPYSASKIGADKLVESYWRSFGTPSVTVRPFNTYGPRQSARAVIPTIVTQALAGHEVRLGSADTVRDFTFVEDTAAGFVAAAKASGVDGEVINLGTGSAVTVGEIVDRVAEILSKPLQLTLDPSRVRPAASEVQRLIADNRRALRLLDWSPEVTLQKGLAITVEAVASALDRYKVGVYSV